MAQSLDVQNRKTEDETKINRYIRSRSAEEGSDKPLKPGGWWGGEDTERNPRTE